MCESEIEVSRNLIRCLFVNFLLLCYAKLAYTGASKEQILSTKFDVEFARGFNNMGLRIKKIKPLYLYCRLEGK